MSQPQRPLDSGSSFNWFDTAMTVYTQDIDQLVHTYNDAEPGDPITPEMLTHVLVGIRFLAEHAEIDFYKALGDSYIQYLETRKALAQEPPSGP